MRPTRTAPYLRPDGTPGDGRTAARGQVTFHTAVPTAGAYRLCLDFQHIGQVRTAEFTAVAGAPSAAAVSTLGAPTRSGGAGHPHG